MQPKGERERWQQGEQGHADSYCCGCHQICIAGSSVKCCPEIAEPCAQQIRIPPARMPATLEEAGLQPCLLEREPEIKHEACNDDGGELQ